MNTQELIDAKEFATRLGIKVSTARRKMIGAPWVVRLGKKIGRVYWQGFIEHKTKGLK